MYDDLFYKTMKQTGTTVGAVLLLMFCVSLWAQQKKGGTTGTKETNKPTKKVAYMPVITLGNSGFSGGPIRVSLFDSLLRQGIHSRDTTGNILTIVSFNFNYLERVLYEDSAGDMHMMVDYSKEYCPGDTVTTNVSGSIYEHAKSGDTVIIDQVLLTKIRPNQKTDTFLGKSLKCVLTKS